MISLRGLELRRAGAHRLTDHLRLTSAGCSANPVQEQRGQVQEVEPTELSLGVQFQDPPSPVIAKPAAAPDPSLKDHGLCIASSGPGVIST